MSTSTKRTSTGRSHCLTIRPLGGVGRGSELEKRILKWLSKQEHYCCVSEMEDDKRHLHVQLWSTRTRNLNDLKKSVVRICAKLVPNWDKKRAHIAVQGKYGCSDWYDTYLLNNPEKAGDKVEILGELSVPDDTEPFYPTEEELEDMKSRKAQNEAVDKRMAKLEQLFFQFCDECEEPAKPTYLRCAEALAWMMYEKRLICTLKDDRTCRNLAKKLNAYIRRCRRPTFLSDEDYQNWKDLRDMKNNVNT